MKILDDIKNGNFDMKRLILPLAILLVALVVLLAVLLAGGEEPAATDPTQTSDTAPSTQSTSEPTQPTEESTEPTETEPVLQYANPLTGEPMAELSENRPWAVVMNNVKPAMPLCGAGGADILYEMRVEGGATRCLGIFSDITAAQRVGSIRSARPYAINLAMGYDAIFVHIGASESGNALLQSSGWDEIDGNRGPVTSYFKSDKNRTSAGYAIEHTYFITSEDAIEAATKKGCTLTREGGVSYGLSFAEDGTPDGEAAGMIEVRFYKNGKYTRLTYNEERGLYESYQHGTDNIDGDTGEILSFENVLVVYAETGIEADNGYVHTMKLTGSGEGYFACGGKIVPIKWSRAGDTEPFVYTLEDGTPLTLGIGKSYIAIVPTGIELTYE